MKIIYQRSSLLRLISLAFIISQSKSIANSRSRYAAYDYDLTTPLYTPDGRLLQVEYALNACRRAETNPIVSVGLCIPSKEDISKRRLLDNNSINREGSDDIDPIEVINHGEHQEGDALLIMATVSSPPPSSFSINNSESISNEDGKSDSDSTTSSSRTQRRIIEVPLSTSFQTHHTTTSTAESTILIGLSGILADATSLLQIAYSTLEEEQLSFGWHRLGLSPVGTVSVDATNASDKRKVINAHPQQTSAQSAETAIRLARAIGDKCQKHAFGGGLRPLGASLLVAGVDCDECSVKLAMCETEPSGAVTATNPYWLTSIGKRIPPPQVKVSGGSIQSQTKLKQLMTSRVRQLYLDIGTELEDKKKVYSEEEFLRRSLQTVVNTLVEEWKDRGSLLANNSDKKQQSISLPQMEIVFTTPKKGTFRLSKDNIEALMEKTENDMQTIS